MRCPRCEHISVTKVLETEKFVGICFEPNGDYFICTNPRCDVQRIYGDNGVLLIKDENKQDESN